MHVHSMYKYSIAWHGNNFALIGKFMCIYLAGITRFYTSMSASMNDDYYYCYIDWAAHCLIDNDHSHSDLEIYNFETIVDEQRMANYCSPRTERSLSNKEWNTSRKIHCKLLNFS